MGEDKYSGLSQSGTWKGPNFLFEIDIWKARDTQILQMKDGTTLCDCDQYFILPVNAQNVL